MSDPAPVRSSTVCHEIHQVLDGEDLWWLEINVTAQAHDPARPWPFAVSADLGRRIADLIRPDLAAAPGNDTA